MKSPERGTATATSIIKRIKQPDHFLIKIPKNTSLHAA
jgi:hypothetical protein